MIKATVWITGARGFIGRHLARWLAGQGYSVVGIGHGRWPASEAAAWGVQRWVNGDIHSSNLQHLKREGGPPDIIFHLAGGSSVGTAIASPYEDFTRTVVSTAELLDWARLEAQHARLVAVSSAAVYGAGHAGPVSEDEAHVPFSPYGYHKLMMETLCRSYSVSYGLPIVIVRLFSVYGCWLKKQLLWDLCTRLALGTGVVELAGSGEELRDWTDIRDVVRVLRLAMDYSFESTAMPVINAGTGQATKVSQIAELVIGSWPVASTVCFNGRSRDGDPFSLVAESSLLTAMRFDWNVPVTTGVCDYVQWFLQYARSQP